MTPTSLMHPILRGTLGLPAFKNMLNDPRTQGIPLILETPSFEKPVEVWGVEIKVLNALSGIDAAGGADTTNQPTIEELVEEVREAVKSVDLGSKAKGKTKAKVTKSVAKKGGKRKRKQESEDEESDEE